MSRIELIIGNGNETRKLSFPCKDSQMQEICDSISVTETAAKIVRVITPNSFSLLNGKAVDLDEINYLAKRVNEFNERDRLCFFAATETEKYTTPKDLINLACNIKCYTLISDVSSFGSIGYNYLISQEEYVSDKDLRNKDFEKIGKELLDSGLGQTTSYGLLFKNRDTTFVEYYDGHSGFPLLWFNKGNVFILNLEFDRKHAYVAFPGETIEVDKALKRIGAASINKCGIYVETYSEDRTWEDIFEDLIKDGELDKANELAEAISPVGMNYKDVPERMEKISAVMDYAETSDTDDIIKLARNLDEFGYIGGVYDGNSLGKQLMQNAGYNIPSEIDEYIEYSRYGQTFMREYNGQFVGYRKFVYMKNSDITLDDILDKNTLSMEEIQ